MTNTGILELCSKKGQTTQTLILLSSHVESKSDLYLRLTLLTLLSLYSETPSFSAISGCQIFKNFQRSFPYGAEFSCLLSTFTTLRLLLARPAGTGQRKQI